MERRRENSVRNLQFLYSIFVVLALENVIQIVVVTDRDGIPINWNALPLTLAFLFVLVPFYHGALRHLDESYVGPSVEQLKPYALLGDFIVLFLESALLYSLANQIENPRYFAGFLIALLVVDGVWGEFIRRLFVTERHDPPEAVWAIINFATILWLVVWMSADQTVGIDQGVVFTSVLVITCITRSIVDYKTSWNFYFPN